MKVVWLGLLLLAQTVAFAFVFHPSNSDTSRFWILLACALYVPAAWATWQMARENRLTPLLRLRSGDLSVGAFCAFVLLACTWLGRTQFAALGSPRQAWLFRVYLQIGDPERIQGSIALSLLLMGIAVSQELLYRGYVQEVCNDWLGERRGWIASAAASAFVMTPTLWTLRAHNLGLNPLLFLLAILMGLLLGFLRRITGRLPPVFVAQMAFSYFSVAQFRLPGL